MKRLTIASNGLCRTEACEILRCKEKTRSQVAMFRERKVCARDFAVLAGAKLKVSRIRQQSDIWRLLGTRSKESLHMHLTGDIRAIFHI